MNKRDIRYLYNWWHGRCRKAPTPIWYHEAKELLESGDVTRIYEIYTQGFLGEKWLIITANGNRFLLENEVNDVNTSFVINQLRREFPEIGAKVERVESSALK